MSEDSETRLRRLDVLFAKRVLGRIVTKDTIRVGPDDDGWHWCRRPGEGGILLPGPYLLPHYTRSLDAAWEAPSRLLHEVEFNRLNETGLYKCHLRTDYSDELVRGQEWVHPAEALVLACLRAVGVSEEELA